MKILVVGYGSIGKRHVKNLLSLTKSEIIICTKRKNLDISKKKNVKIFASLEKCLHEKPDIGFITNETAFHIPVTLKLAKQGIDLFIEKPLSNSIKDINELRSIVAKKKLIVQMGCQFRFHKCIKKIHQLIQQKKIGKIISIQVENSSYLPDWHPYEDYTKGYAALNRLGGGIVLTQIHDLDYLYWFFGKPVSIFSITKKFSDLKLSVDDFSASTLEFKNNVVAQIHQQFFQGPPFMSCKIKGTNGVIYWDSNSNEVRLFNNRKKKWITLLKLKNFQRNQMFEDEVRDFLKCVKNRHKTINDLNDGIMTLKMALAIKKSAKEKKIIKFNYRG